MCQVSGVMCPVSRVTCNLFNFIFYGNGVELACGGSVINNLHHETGSVRLWVNLSRSVEIMDGPILTNER